MSEADATPGLPARRAALRLLDAVLRNGQTLDAVANQALADVTPGPDRALAMALAHEALRWLPELDVLIDSATPQPLGKDIKARSVLRLALVQPLRLGTPPHAAIATTLPLVAGGPRRLVHGVFGTLLRRGATLPPVPTLPEGVAGRWAAAWGFVMLKDAAAALAEPPPTDLAIAGAPGTMPTHRRLPRGDSLADDADFGSGRAWVQNLAAQLPAWVLGEGAGATLLDLCAAPGGKTMQLAAAGWRVTALDSNPRRVERLRDNLARTGLVAEVVPGDLLSWTPPALADAVLLDAPCTATGTFARHPDVLHRIDAGDIARLAALQTRMMERALGFLKPGGRLVYGTCSLEPEEGEGIAQAFASRLLPIDGAGLPDWAQPTADGWLRILPEPGRDGFFVAAFA